MRGTRALLLGSAIAVMAGAGARAAPAKPTGLPAVEQLLRTGQYEKARRAAEPLARRKGGAGARAAILAARAEQALGLLREARRRLELAAAANDADLPLRAELIRVVDAIGDRGAVKDLAGRSYDDWQAGRVDKRSAADLTAVAVAVRFDDNHEDANAVFRAAVRADARWLEANLAWGELFLDKHAADNAMACFRDVLAVDAQNPDAHAGLGRALLDQGYDAAAAETEIAAALAVNPRHGGALAARGQIALDAEDLDAVAQIVAELRRTNPDDAGAAWLASARALLLEDSAAYQRERDRRLEVRAADGELFVRVAEALVRQRRYQDARKVAADGVERDPTHARLVASLGNTLLRLGEEDEGLAMLRRAWERDPYDVRTYNLLNLFEKVIARSYVMVNTAHLRFRIEPAARAAIEAVVAPFLEATYERYAARYGLRPQGPVVFELYGSPEHYAVRTVGVPHLGVAGVCFGRVITSQAPTNAAFNWGMVLAHELAHVFALELARSRVPRWLAEGLAELETAHLRDDWRRQMDLALYAALATDTLPPLTTLSQAFVRAPDTEAAALAYMHAAAAADFLERRFGFARVRAALVAYGRGERGAPVLEALAGMPAATLEAAFREDLAAHLGYLRGQFLPSHFARRTRNPARLRAQAAASSAAPTAAQLASLGLGALAGGDRRAAEAALAQARALPGAGDPHVRFLDAELALAGGRPAEARRELQRLIADGHDGYDVQVRIGLTSLRLEDKDAALAAFRRAVEQAPKAVEARTLLAEHLGRVGRAEEKLAVETEILRLEPQSAALARRVVLEHARAGHTGVVAEVAPSAIFIVPADPDLHAALGRALAAQGKPADGARALERALLFAPADPRPVQRALGDLYEKLGETKRAAAARAAATAAPP